MRTATGASVARIEQTITEINAIAGSIVAAVEQQGAATAEIARNVTETAEAANEMTRRTNEVSTEAELTGGQANVVLDNTTALNNAVGELKHSLTRVVRTSTTEVDRWQTHRYDVDLACRLSIVGQGNHTARVIDLAEGGAGVQGAPNLAPGTRGKLTVDAIGMLLPFTLRTTDSHGVLHLAFNLDEKAQEAFRGVPERLGLRRAA